MTYINPCGAAASGDEDLAPASMLALPACDDQYADGQHGSQTQDVTHSVLHVHFVGLPEQLRAFIAAGRPARIDVGHRRTQVSPALT